MKYIASAVVMTLIFCCLTHSVGADDAVSAGAKIAQQGTPKGATACMSCHGADGAGLAAAGFPRLAGLDAGYLAKQIRDFQLGTRSNPIMLPIAKALNGEEIVAVSTYYSTLPLPDNTLPDKQGPATQASAAEGKNLAQWGDWRARALPACGQCHGLQGNGVGSHFPGIAGQQAGYIKAQLQAWKTGTRNNDALGLMKSVASKLTDAEIEAVSAYYAALPPGKPITPTSPAAVQAMISAAAADDVYTGEVPQHGAPPKARAVGEAGFFKSPGRDAFPQGPFGDVVRDGEAIFQNTNAHPVSAKFVGNSQACGNCHIDAGRLPESAPLWAAWVAYPAYRSKNKKVNTYIERLQGCFNYSMNAQASAAGGPPASDSETIVALVAYSYWLAEGAPTGDEAMPGRGFPRLADTSQGFEPQRGEKIYNNKCAFCHGEQGQGAAYPDGRILYPPLWGAEAYNWGAGMHNIDVAAAFIKHNMPFGLAGSLTDQEAWDVAAFMNSHERPQDPRFKGDLQDTMEKFHGSIYDYYGKRKSADGFLLGERPAARK